MMLQGFQTRRGIVAQLHNRLARSHLRSMCPKGLRSVSTRRMATSPICTALPGSPLEVTQTALRTK